MSISVAVHAAECSAAASGRGTGRSVEAGGLMLPAAALLVLAARPFGISLEAGLAPAGIPAFSTASLAAGGMALLAAAAGLAAGRSNRHEAVRDAVLLVLGTLLCLRALSWVGLVPLEGAPGLCALPSWFALRRTHARLGAAVLLAFGVFWLSAGLTPSWGLAAVLLLEWLVCSAVQALFGTASGR